MAVGDRPVVGKILVNDIHPDGDKLKIIFVTSPTKNGSHVITNKNGTVTFFPATNFIGIDSFSYTVSDGKGKIDNAIVSVSVKQVHVRTVDQTNSESTTTKGKGEQSGDQMQNQIDRVQDKPDRRQKLVQEKAPTNASIGSIP
jgi:hypothetical protein